MYGELDGTGESTFKMAFSLGSFLAVIGGPVPNHVDLSIGLFECLPNMASGFPTANDLRETNTETGCLL